MSLAGRVGLVIIILFALVACFAPWLAPHDPNEIFSEGILLPMGGWGTKFVFGTDDVGRDLMSRLIYGARLSFIVGLAVVVVSTICGTLLGLIAGTLGGFVETVILRVMDFLLAVPSLLLAIIVIAILGPGLANTVVAVSLVALPSLTRVVRGCVILEENKNYVVATKGFGGSWWDVAVRAILPNCLGPILVQSSFAFGDGILNAAALGFLGLGVQPPTPEWGTMLADSRNYIETSTSLVTLPGVCLLVCVLGFHFLGDGLRGTRRSPAKKKLPLVDQVGTHA